ITFLIGQTQFDARDVGIGNAGGTIRLILAPQPQKRPFVHGEIGPNRIETDDGGQQGIIRRHEIAAGDESPAGAPADGSFDPRPAEIRLLSEPRPPSCCSSRLDLARAALYRAADRSETMCRLL